LAQGNCTPRRAGVGLFAFEDNLAMDVFLLLFVMATVAGAVYANVRLLMYFQHSDGSQFSESVFCKSIIVASLTLAWVVNILLPVDVRSSRPTPSGLDMQIVWTIAFVVLAVFLVVIVPATMFYHETEGDTTIKKPWQHVLCSLGFTLVIVVGGVAISYAGLKEASMPVREYSCSHWLNAASGTAEFGESVCSNAEDADLQFSVGFSIYLVAVMCFVGWFFFVTFGGIGLSALPIDLILAFVDRPQAINEQTYQQRRGLIGNATSSLLRRSDELMQKDGELANRTGWRARRKQRALNSEYNKFKRDVHLVEEEFERLQVSKFHKGENLAVSVTKLVLGIIFAVVSLLWILHIVFYILIRPNGVPLTPFLNALFTSCESTSLYPIGVTLFASFTLYLLLCVIKGCMKFGMRFFFFFSIHPMRYKATPLNSILFNVLMVLISSATVVQFSQESFADYARLTGADVIFAAQVKHLVFYGWFFENNVFIYTLLLCFLVALIYLIVRPREGSSVNISADADKRLKSLGAAPASAT